MKERNTEYGKFYIGTKSEIFDQAVALVDGHRREKELLELTWALTGGSTPAEFYKYCAEKKSIPAELLKATCWFTSDERVVPLGSDESNFGNAARQLLDPLGVPTDNRFPWPVDHEPEDAAVLFNEIWHTKFSDFRCFDVCFLGMGDDCHTASIFPGSPLTKERGEKFFAYVEVEAKGPRLTVTQKGLEHCGLIVVMVTGKNKAIPLYRVFNELCEPRERPIQLLRHHRDRVVWLVDDAAVSELGW